MVLTRNMKRTAADSPAPMDSVSKRQKLPVRPKDEEATPTKAARKNEGNRSASKKRPSHAMEPEPEASTSEEGGVQGQQMGIEPEQQTSVPELKEDRVVNDSEASPESGNEVQEESSPDAESSGEPAEGTTESAAEAADDSDSDEAPEAVSTTKAAVQAKKSAQAANKAIAEQAATQKRKRQERNARLQEQAATRKAQKTSAVEEEPKDDGEEIKSPAVVDKIGRRRLDRLEIPAELPAEFLDSDSEEEEAEAAEPERKPPRKARKLHTAEAQIARQSRGPKDEVVGTTMFRVVKKQDERLTPKAHKHSINAKKALLQRRRVPVKTNKGFFVQKQK